MSYMTDAKTEAIEQALSRWADRRLQHDADRDSLVRLAVAQGITKHRVHLLTGIARTTIDRIVNGQDGGQQ